MAHYRNGPHIRDVSQMTTDLPYLGRESLIGCIFREAWTLSPWPPTSAWTGKALLPSVSALQ